jgi:hypothetical protein
MSLKQRLGQAEILLAPGVYDALTGLIAEQSGAQAVYLSGASIAYTRFGRPDIGLVSMSEVADTIAALRDRIALPIVVDADNGFGNALNVQRTVRVFERMGANALQLEDQTMPKRCGHLDGKSLISKGEMAGKIRAACDARQSEETLIIGRAAWNRSPTRWTRRCSARPSIRSSPKPMTRATASTTRSHRRHAGAGQVGPADLRRRHVLRGQGGDRQGGADGRPADGDIYIFNDAHIGGTHLSDMRLVRPISATAELFCYLASVGHWHDVGGAVPGNYNPAATEAFQEAFILPPVKLVARAARCSRTSSTSCCATPACRNRRWATSTASLARSTWVKRMDALLDEYGAGTVPRAGRPGQDRAEALMRAELSDLPDGRWEAEDFLDNDGITDTAAADPRGAGDRRATAWCSISRARRRQCGARSTSPCRRRSPLPTSRSSTSSGPAGQCRRHAADRGQRPGGIRFCGGSFPPRRRLHRDHPQDDRRDLLRRVAGRARSGSWPTPTAPSTRCRSPASAPTASPG